MFNERSWGCRILGVVVSASLLGLTGGCAHDVMPSATVGDPTVFTTLHMVAADRAYAHDAEALGDETGAKVGVSTLAHLQRYFGSTPASYEKGGLRSDMFLDQTQRSQAFAFLLARALQVEVQYNKAGLKEPTFAESGTADVANAQPTVLAGGVVKPKVASAESVTALKEAKDKLKKLTDEKVGLEASIKAEEAKANESSAAASTTTQKLTTLEAEQKDLTANEATKKSELEALNTKYAALLKNVDDRTKKLASLKTEQEKLPPLKQTVTKLAAELKKLQADGAAQDVIAKKQQELTAATEARDKQDQAVKQLEKEVADLTALITPEQAHLDEIDAKKKELADASGKFAAKTQEVTQATELIKSSKADKAAADEKLKTYKAREAELPPLIAVATKEVETAQAAVSPPAPTNDASVAISHLADPNDSPFDRLDRVNDWYMSYMMLILSAYGGDSRALDPDGLRGIFKQSYTREASALKTRSRDYLGIALPGLDRLSEEEWAVPFVQYSLNRLKIAPQHDLVDASDWRAITDALKAKMDETTRTASAKRSAANNAAVAAAGAPPAAAPAPPPSVLEQIQKASIASAKMQNWMGLAPGVRAGPAAPLPDPARLRDLVTTKEVTPGALMAAVNDAIFATETLAIDLVPLTKAEADVAIPAPTPVATDGDKFRMVTLLVPVTIRAGTRPNTLVGSRIEVVGVSRNTALGGQEPNVDDVRVLTLYPQRSYDLEDEQLTQSFRDTLKLIVEAQYAKVGAKADFSMDKKQEEASRFLSRVAKIGAWQDGPSHAFGWTFSPSNVHVVPRPLGKQFLDLVGGQPGRAYEAQSLLETGARRCSVTILVRANIDRIDLKVSDYRLDVDRGKISFTESLVGTEADTEFSTARGIIVTPPTPDRVLKVTLPAFDPLERLAFTLPRP